MVIRPTGVRSIGEYADGTFRILPENLVLRSPCAVIVNPADIVLAIVISVTVINKQPKIATGIFARRQIGFGHQTAYRGVNPNDSVRRKILVVGINVLFAGSKNQRSECGHRQDWILC